MKMPMLYEHHPKESWRRFTNVRQNRLRYYPPKEKYFIIIRWLINQEFMIILNVFSTASNMWRKKLVELKELDDHIGRFQHNLQKLIEQAKK